MQRLIYSPSVVYIAIQTILPVVVLVLEVFLDIVAMEYALMAKTIHHALKIVLFLLVIVETLFAIQIQKRVVLARLTVVLVSLV
jgi:hypothetical protein